MDKIDRQSAALHHFCMLHHFCAHGITVHNMLDFESKICQQGKIFLPIARRRLYRGKHCISQSPGLFFVTKPAIPSWQQNYSMLYTLSTFDYKIQDNFTFIPNHLQHLSFLMQVIKQHLLLTYRAWNSFPTKVIFDWRVWGAF